MTEAHPGAGLGDYNNPGVTATVPTLSSWPNWIGPIQYLECPDQYVISHLGIRYELDTGKIRRVKITCRPIW